MQTLNTFLSDAASTATEDRVLWHAAGAAPAVRLSAFRARLAALRHKLSGHPAERWLLYSDDPQHFLLGFLVLLGSGKKVVICASRKPQWLQSLVGEFDAILSDEVIEVTAKSAPQVAGKPAWLPCVDFDPEQQPAEPWQPVFDGSERLVFFTSGSTGEPKAIAKTLLALTNEVTTLYATFGREIRAGVFIASVSHLHIYGLLFRLLLPLLVKGSGVRQQIEYPEQLLRAAQALKATGGARPLVFISSPTYLSRLDLCLPSCLMQAVFSSGGPLSATAAQQARRYFGQLPIEVYGSTETGGIGYRQQASMETAWTPFAGVDLSETEDGATLRSPNMPDEPPFLLDDHLEFLPDGQFRLKGRKDRVVKIAEKRVSLTEVERFLEAQATIRQCVALPAGGRREGLACAIVLSDAGELLLARSGQRALIQGWRAVLQQRFDAVALPRQWRVVAEIPVNSQSKIDSARLLALFATEGEAS